MATGTIKKKMDDKGFGFIAVEGGGDDVFFHTADCGGQFESLNEGASVQFDIENGEKGKRAKNVVAA